jgi:hypothetical protein
VRVLEEQLQELVKTSEVHRDALLQTSAKKAEQAVLSKADWINDLSELVPQAKNIYSVVRNAVRRVRAANGLDGDQQASRRPPAPSQQKAATSAPEPSRQLLPVDEPGFSWKRQNELDRIANTA